MINKILTIAIATYNMENYLPTCIESLLVPSVLKNLEILIINDGSSDSSSQIAHNYSRNYPDSIFVVDKENGGYGSALNVAIKLASAAYFKILDPDDRLDSHMLELFINKLKDTDVDIIVTHFSYENKEQNSSEPSLYKGVEFDLPYDFSQFIFTDRIDDAEVSMHAITYKTEILQKDNFQLSECFYCDTDYTAYPLRHAKNILFFDICLYKYSVGLPGQSISYHGFAQHYRDHQFITKKLVDFYTRELSEDYSAFGMNIGYKAARVLCFHIHILYNFLYKTDKALAEKEILSFKEYVQSIDSELKELAEMTFIESDKKMISNQTR